MSSHTATRGGLDPITDDLSDIGATVKKAATQAVSTARTQLDQAADSIADEAFSVEQWLQDCATQKPIQTILTAAGVGLLIGLWMRRK